MKLAVEAEKNTDHSKLTKPQIIDVSTYHLSLGRLSAYYCLRRRLRRSLSPEEIREYFSLGITVEGMANSLPLLIHDGTPNLDMLPLFLVWLGPQVNSHDLFQQEQILNQFNWNIVFLRSRLATVTTENDEVYKPALFRVICQSSLRLSFTCLLSRRQSKFIIRLIIRGPVNPSQISPNLNGSVQRSSP